MKRLIPLLVAVVITAHTAIAEEKKKLDVEEYDSVSIGINGFHISGDLGSRYDLTTPFWRRFALRLSYFEQETDFGPPGNRFNDYTMAGLGVLVAFTGIRNGMRTYADIGYVELLDNSELSLEKRNGRYAMLHLEYLLLGEFFSGPLSIQFGIGYVTTYSKADEIPGAPVFAHGSAVSSGAVFYF
ncbi:MAG: hypothetical protein GY866_17140 [Proteobacteria bacterium]|nr:hypothetical protein [Pseudomonadota bacterium]